MESVSGTQDMSAETSYNVPPIVEKKVHECETEPTVPPPPVLSSVVQDIEGTSIMVRSVEKAS